MNTVSSGNSFLGRSGICLNRFQEKTHQLVRFLHYLLCVGQVEENMGCRVVSAAVGSPDEPLFLHSVSPAFGTAPVAYFWVSQAPRTSRDILGKLCILVTVKCLLPDPKDGHILNLGFLICRIELMARGWGMRELSQSPLEFQRTRVVKAYYLMTMFKMEVTHWTSTVLALSDRPKPERNERNWSKGQGPV